MTSTTGISAKECSAQLANIAGEAHTQLAGYAVTVAPLDAAQTAEILRFADANGVSVTPCGSGTKAGWGNPVAPGIRLLLNRMNSLREHPWQDMTCTVEAGCTWAAMQESLAQHGQMVALDPLWPERATVGGIVATNDSGALRLKYGGLRDLIIGMTIVLPDGTIAKTGGKVVKNVAGYDLHKLMTGSFGTLGVIAEVNFRLHPAETAARTWTATAPDASQFAEPLRILLDTQMTPSSIQLRVGKLQSALDVRIATRPEAFDEQAARLRKIFGEIALSESGNEVWQARQQLFDKADSVILKASMLSSDVCSVSSEFQHLAAKQGFEFDLAAQATGLMTLALKINANAVPALLEQLRSRVRAAGGSVIALQIPESIRAGLDVWGCDSSALALMREIKRRFDPHRTLNPGRFVGNI